MADYNNNNVIDRELGWDDTIENDSPEYILLEEGEYDFTVDHLDRERHEGSEKLPPCWKAVLYLKVETPEGVATIRHNLFLHTRTEGMMCAFFTCIGQRQHGQRLKPRWAEVPGAKGRAIFRTREYNGKKYNEVKKFLEPVPAAAPGGYQQPAYQQTVAAYPPQGPNYQQPQGPAYAPQQGGGYVPGKF